MLKYTFSTREKVMLAVLLVAAIIIGWRQFVYLPIQNQIDLVESQINATQDEILSRQGTAASLNEMNAHIEEYKAQGLTPVFLPQFDNTRQLMIYLNATLGSTIEYSINFDNPEKGEDGTVHRLGGITFSVPSYSAARSIINQISGGPYFCSIDAMSINDRSAASGKSTGNTEVRLDVTYYETMGSFNENAQKEEEAEGNDLSVLTNWNEQ